MAAGNAGFLYSGDHSDRRVFDADQLPFGQEDELSLTLGMLTYSVSILLTFGVSLVVGWMVARKNKKIDMVEALKGAE